MHLCLRGNHGPNRRALDTRIPASGPVIPISTAAEGAPTPDLRLQLLHRPALPSADLQAPALGLLYARPCDSVCGFTSRGSTNNKKLQWDAEGPACDAAATIAPLL